MTLEQSRLRASRLRAVPLEMVLQACGAQRDEHDPAKWRTTRGVLSLSGPKFMNWNQGQGGGGAIDLLIHLYRWSFKESLQWLADHFPDQTPFQPFPPTSPNPLKLPAPASGNLQRVTDYLAARAIASDLIAPLIQSGTLYADHRNNAVFLLLDSQNLPVGAELRGTTSACWRGMAPGSRKDHGFFSIPHHGLPSIILCESAIDAISCFALHPNHRCLSTAGARPNPSWLPSLIAKGCKVRCGFDADPTGEAMARAMIALHPAVSRLRPAQKDWNDVLSSQS
jgi:hypothetical protein